jgi:hypothetical protein
MPRPNSYYQPNLNFMSKIKDYSLEHPTEVISGVKPKLSYKDFKTIFGRHAGGTHEIDRVSQGENLRGSFEEYNQMGIL